MRAFVVCLSLFAFIAPAAGARASDDRVYSLVGHWACESALHSMGVMAFTRETDRTISMRNKFTAADGTRGEYDESYSVDPATGHWSWSGGPAHNTAMRQDGSAPPWTTDDRWVIEGHVVMTEPQASTSIVPSKRSTIPMRMVYTQLADGVFRRDVEVPNDAGRWISTSVTTCKKAQS